jgi:hypothetical protein
MRTIPKHIFNINASFYGSQLKSGKWVQDFVTFAEKLRARLGLEFSHFGCKYLEEKSAKPTVKSLKYVKRNARRIEGLLAREDILGIGFVSAEKGADVTRDEEMSLRFYCPDPRLVSRKPYYQFALQVVPEVLACAPQQGEVLGHLVDLVHQVEAWMDTRYGLIQPMNSEKRGGLYFADIFSEHLSPRERERLHLWVRSSHEYDHKIRDVYWGNLITKSHLGVDCETILSQIAHIVGEQYLVEPIPGKYLFTLPVNILEFSTSQDRLQQLAGQVRQVLGSHHLLME